MDFTAPTPVPGPLRNSSSEPPPHRRHGGAGYQFTDSFNNAQFRDNLAILHGLVFELRQGVEDLQFRLQATYEKVEVFLQTLSSMHADLFSDSAEATPMEEPRAALDEGHDRMQCSAAMAREQGAETDSAGILMQNATTKADGTMGEVQFDRQWADQVMFVEEELLTEDLHATWPGYLLGV